MPSAAELLRRFRITPPARGIPARGQFYTTCPECSPWRKKKHAACLSVKVDSEGIQFFCNHCPNNGGAFFDDAKGKRNVDRPGQREAKGKARRSIQDYYR